MKELDRHVSIIQSNQEHVIRDLRELNFGIQSIFDRLNYLAASLSQGMSSIVRDSTFSFSAAACWHIFFGGGACHSLKSPPLFSFTGVDLICNQLDNIETVVLRGFAHLADIIENNEAKRVGIWFKSKLDELSGEYDRIIATRIENYHGMAGFYESVSEVKGLARKLYSRACAYTRTDSEAVALLNYPYVLIMSFAARVRMDASIIMSDVMSERWTSQEKAVFLQRESEELKKFLLFLSNQIVQLVSSSSLLEVAFDLKIYLETYMTLISGFLDSFDLLDDCEKLYKIPVWDDNLEQVR